MVNAITEGYTDFTSDPTAFTFIMLVGCFLLRGMFIDTDAQKVDITVEGSLYAALEKNARGYAGWYSLFLMMCFLSVEIVGWVIYRNNLGTISSPTQPGYLYPRDIMGLFNGITGFCYIMICPLILSGGYVMVMRSDESPGEKRSEGKTLTNLLHLFQNLFWFTYFAGTAALQWSFVKSIENSGSTYNAVTLTNLRNASLMTLLAGICLWVYKFVKAVGDANKGEVATVTYTAEKRAYWPIIFPCEETHPLFIVATLLYTLPVLLITYVDYVKFEVAGSIVVLASVLFTLFSKTLDTFQFHFFLALFCISTIAYTIAAAAPGNDPTFLMDSYTNDGVSKNPLTVNPSQINTPADFQLTYLVTSVTSLITAGYVLLGHTMHYCNACADRNYHDFRGTPLSTKVADGQKAS